MSEKTADFLPDWVSPPGATIADVLEERRLSAGELAERLGRSDEEIHGLLDGRMQITADLAARLASVLGASASFWLNREAQYRSDLQRLALAPSPSDWLRDLPFADMVKFGWVDSAPPSARLAAGLEFFDVETLQEWHSRYSEVLEMTAFRKSAAHDSLFAATAAWLRQGEIRSAAIPCKQWSAVRFRELLTELRPLTRKKDPAAFVPELKKRCAECGVAVVIARAPKGCRASGATRFVSEDRALLLLSFRFLSDDHFWFSFFHEAGHLLLHAARRTFLEGLGVTTVEEEEANDFAAAVLVPPRFHADLFKLRPELKEIARFAREIGVSPGIVVGQLQHHRRVAKNHWNGLKVRFEWDELVDL